MSRVTSQIKGHQESLARFQTALVSGRMASSYLFLGPSGVGKRLVARALAQDLMCEAPKSGSACGSCGSCIRIEKGQHENLLLIEAEGTQIKIDQVRPVRDFVKLRMSGKARVCIIDEAHTFTPQAANALLKVLEEPPPHHHFFLISSQEGAVLPTLRSRCQAIRFSPLSLEQLKSLKPSKPWALASAQGRMDRLEMLLDEGTEDIRRAALEMAKNAVEDNLFALGPLIPTVNADKSTALFAVQVWQLLIRDAWFKKEKLSALINMDAEDVIDGLAGLSTPSLDRLASQSLQLERDIHSNIDRTLLFENFWSSFSREQMREKARL